MDESRDEPLRLAILSTPRSGNTWLRHLLATLYDMPHQAVHRPGDLDWDILPGRCLVQLHWHRVEPLVSQLERHRFRVVALSRHPFDTLISLLSWVNNCPEPGSLWKDFASLDGDCGDERPLLDLHPCDRGFAEYATGPRARALLSVSRQWWEAPGCLKVQYEGLVGDPAGTLATLVDAIGLAPARPIAEAIEANSMEGLRRAHPVRSLHFWQGRPGLWKELLPGPLAREVADAHPEPFATFGYPCDPDPSLTEDRAIANWFRLQHDSLRRERLSKRSPGPPGGADSETARTLESTRTQLDEVHRLLYEERASHQATAARLLATSRQLDEVHRLLYEARQELEGTRHAAGSSTRPRGPFGVRSGAWPRTPR